MLGHIKKQTEKKDHVRTQESSHLQARERHLRMKTTLELKALDSKL